MSVNISVFGRYLLERDFPGMRIGPEPTTDNFHVIEYADEEGKIPGTATPLITGPRRHHLQTINNSMGDFRGFWVDLDLHFPDGKENMSLRSLTCRKCVIG